MKQTQIIDDFALGTAYLQQHQFDLALKCFNQAIQAHPNHAAAYLNRGVLYAQQGQVEYALQDYQQAMQWDPKNAQAYNNRGVLYAQQGQLEQALKDYQHAMQLDPQNAQAYNNRGVLYAQQGDFNRALEDYDHALALNPNYASAYNNRGLLHAQQGQPESALEDYHQAMHLDPKYIPCYYDGRGLFYAKQGQIEQALNDFNQVIQATASREQRKLYCFHISSYWMAVKQFKHARDSIEQAFAYASNEESMHKKTYLDNINKTEELYRANAALEKHQQQLEEAQYHQREMVRKYNHDLANILRPERIKTVAQKLDREALQAEYLLLDEAYRAELLVRNQSTWLKMKHVDKDPDKLQSLLRGDILLTQTEEGSQVLNIFYLALERIVSYVLNYEKFREQRGKILQKNHLSLEEVKQTFNKQVRLAQQNIVAWVNEYFFPLQLIEFSELWKSLLIKQYGYAEVLLDSYFAELFLNVFKYSDYRSLTIRFYQDDHFLLSRWENSYGGNCSMGTGIGLRGMNEELKMLNHSDQEAVHIEDDGQGIFRVTWALRKDLLVYQPQPRQYPRVKRASS